MINVFGNLSLLLSLATYALVVLGATPLGQTLPKFLHDPQISSSRGLPWGNTKPDGPPPDTGVTRKYDFTITRNLGAPDGLTRSLILVNNRYPGPIIEANWGDTIHVKVRNRLTQPTEGTSIHWHGQPQRLSPWMDGVPTTSQCPITPGHDFDYIFRAESYGTSWYHSHYGSQYIDGLFGAMVIYGPSHQDYDIDLGPVMVYDYLHFPYQFYTELALGVPGTFLALDNNMINGQNPFNCSYALHGTPCDSSKVGFANFHFKKGKIHRLRVINTGSVSNQKFAIDGHQMMVIAQDYVPIVPYNTSVLTLGVGQRNDILVFGSGEVTDTVWMRSSMDTNELCGNESTIQSNAKAVIYYDEADKNELPSTVATPWKSNDCRNDPLGQQVPYYKKTPPTQPDVTNKYEIVFRPNATGSLVFYINNVTFFGDFNQPLLLLAQHGNESFPNNPEWAAENFGRNESARAIWINNLPIQHPLHLHGHDFWVLAEGFGEWDGVVTSPKNPARRDTQILQPSKLDGTPSFVVLEWQSDNPGVWPFHCHVAVHGNAGLVFNVIEQPDRIQKYEQIPEIFGQTCKAWWKWSGANLVDQIGSGM